MKPILFNSEMVRAILEGRKTVTRRVVKPQPEPDYAKVSGMYLDSNGRLCAICYFCKGGIHAVYPPYDRGDILWVRETWSQMETGQYLYKADNEKPLSFLGWRPSIHMPQEAARIFLRVIDIRADRLQELTLRDAEMEGMDPRGPMFTDFVRIWDSTIKPKDIPTYGWDTNPWVWVIKFERINKGEAIGRCAE